MDSYTMLLYQNNCSGKDYLQALLASYPYDIEESLVLSLLTSNPYPYPALLAFIEYARHVHKYHIVTKHVNNALLETLFINMCKIAQRNHTVLYTHQFQFDATLYAKQYSFDNPYAQLPLQKIVFIDSIQLHIPASIQMNAIQPITIMKATHCIYRNLSLNAFDYLALRIQLADCYGLVFLPKKCISLLCACATLYQVCPPTHHNDFFLVFGVALEKSTALIYEDRSSELTIGLFGGSEENNHFQHLKDMISTLYSCHCLKKHDFPIHGAMIQLHFPQTTLGLVFIGTQGSGKSALCDSICRLCEKENTLYTKVFDDLGTLHNLDNDIYATGSEIGTYVQVNDLPQATLFKKLNASLLLQEKQITTHIILPFTSLEELSKFHKVNFLFYLDTTKKQRDMQVLTNLQETFDLLYHYKYRTHRSSNLLSIPFWGSFSHSFDEQASATLLHEFLTTMYVNNHEILHVSTFHTSHTPLPYFDKKANQIYHYILTYISEKEDCEKS